MILDNIRQLSSYQTLLDSIRNGVVPDPLSLIRSVRLPIVAGLWQDLNCPVLFITSRQEKASSAMDELEFWQPGMRLFSFTEPTPLFYEEAGWSSNTRQDRLATLTSLAGYHLPGTEINPSPPVIISSAKSLMTRTMPRRDYLKSILRIANNTQKPQNSLIEQLVQNGYQFAEIVVEPGQFSHRGGVIDIWAMGDKVPVRLDYFGDDIETIKLFDPATQRTIEKCEVDQCPSGARIPFTGPARDGRREAIL